ncbi:hypothetical protein BKP42_67630 [Rhodococcus erythropolis]|uniref:NucA/NucB deoxyribonuclease domain-containing protein n=1 Tax=Rhodococcus erythropolis TaxID=1833 RepID=UPI000BB3E178|nr:NucA/NucB deoxyribonuclease domain-containing protein [Rhodococcus erythropolis]PBI83776.1 hypothetical protein BKP42_67630 [Rhodococcus erythropolis]
MKHRKLNAHSTIPVLLVVVLLSMVGAQVANAEPAPEEPNTEEPSQIPRGQLTQTMTISSPDDQAEVDEITNRIRESKGNSLARVEPYECFDDRFNSCDAFKASIVQEAKEPGGPVVQFGRWDVYVTMMMRVQARQPTGIMFVDAEVVKVLPESIPGTLVVNVTQLKPGIAPSELVGSLHIPVTTGYQGADDQIDIDSPPADYYQEISDFATDWTLDTPVPGMSQSYGTEMTDISLRCDEVVGAFPGCVNPDYVPTLKFSGLPNININIGNHQALNGVGAPGGTPLHRGESALNTVANRDAACRTDRESTLGPPPSNMTNPSCDEYPFASSKEGGGNASVRWVPLAENNSQGGQTSTFYQNNRVMPGDAFYVTY